jgi:hypothetical protein
MSPIKGQWLASDGTLYTERMIPVRIVCTQEQIEKIADMTAAFYNQIAIMYWVISTEVIIKYYENPQQHRKDA